MLKIFQPNKKDYKEIVNLVNEADCVFFDIYTKNEAVIVGVSCLVEEDLILGEKAKKYLILRVEMTRVAI